MDSNLINQIVNQVLSELDKIDNTNHSNETSSLSSKRNKSLKVAIGADHGGFTQKEFLKKNLLNLGYFIDDCGTFSKDSVHYPDIAIKVGKKVSSQECDFGIMLDGAGIGSSMVINKISGCRAALCYNKQTILNSKVHNDANALTLGAPYHSNEDLLDMVLLWLKTDFEGGRHKERVDKINYLDNNKPCECKH